MDINKSSRHAKIIGDFGENLICNLLSRSGFEVVIVDHTGIDIIAYNQQTEERLGITVKSRTRTSGTEDSAVNIFKSGNDNRQKLMNACKSFACEPWIGIYVEASDYANIYLTSLKNYDLKYNIKEKKIATWKMKEKDLVAYKEDPNTKNLKIEFKFSNWF
jgi:Holliday junction resolvase